MSQSSNEFFYLSDIYLELKWAWQSSELHFEFETTLLIRKYYCLVQSVV